MLRGLQGGWEPPCSAPELSEFFTCHSSHCPVVPQRVQPSCPADPWGLNCAEHISSGDHTMIPARINGFLFSSQLSNLAERGGSKSSSWLAGIDSLLKHVCYSERCPSGGNVKWLRNETCQQNIYTPNSIPRVSCFTNRTVGHFAKASHWFQQRTGFSHHLSQPWCCRLSNSILGTCLRLSAGVGAIWSGDLRYLNHKSFSHIVDKSRWRQKKLSCDTCNLSGWAEGGKAGSTHSYPHSSSACCDPSWVSAGWTGCYSLSYHISQGFLQ